MGFMDAVNEEGVVVVVSPRRVSMDPSQTLGGLAPGEQKLGEWNLHVHVSSNIPPAMVSSAATVPATPALVVDVPAVIRSSGSGKYTREEVAMHNTAGDCWFILGDKVIDITPFINTHPGGREVLAGQGGKDATKIFKLIQHSDFAVGESAKFVVGELVEGKARL
jgi:hypothetical protein